MGAHQTRSEAFRRHCLTLRREGGNTTEARPANLFFFNSLSRPGQLRLVPGRNRLETDTHTIPTLPRLSPKRSTPWRGCSLSKSRCGFSAPFFTRERVIASILNVQVDARRVERLWREGHILTYRDQTHYQKAHSVRDRTRTTHPK